MTQWSIWGGFMKKTRGQKSRATVPLNGKCYERFRRDDWLEETNPIEKQMSSRSL
jgi:hypothetical protein